MSNHDELLIDVLRAAGHGDAAELASKVLQHGQAAKPPVAPAPPPARATPGFTNHDDAVRNEGEMILAAMREKGVLPALPIAPESDAA